MAAACGGQGSHGSQPTGAHTGTTSPPAAVLHPGGGAVGALIADAVARLDRHDLVGYCRDFAPGAAAHVAQMPASGNCDDPVLARAVAACPTCRRSDQIVSISVDYGGANAVAHVKVRNSVASPDVISKDVRATKVDGEWKLLDSPAATVP